MKTANENKKENKKFAPLISYLVAVVLLVAGLLVPFGTSGFGLEGMLATQLPEALRNILSGSPLWESAVGEVFTTPVPLNFFGSGFIIDIAALFVILYALTTLIALIMIIPACLSSKLTKTCRKIAFGVEITAAICLTLYTLAVCSSGENAIWNYAPFIALVGVLVILCAQSIVAFKRRGATKTVLLWLSALATFFVLPIITLIPALGTPIVELCLGIEAFASGTFSFASGIGYLSALFNGNFEIFSSGDIANIMFNIFTLLTTLLIIYNLLADITATSFKNRRSTLTCNFLRYFFALLFLVVTMIISVIMKGDGMAIGFFSLIIAAILLAQTILALCRLVKKLKALKRKKAAKAAAANTPSPEALERNRQIYSAPEEEPRVVGTNPNPPVIVNVNAAAQPAEPAPQPEVQEPAPAEEIVQPEPQPEPEQYAQPTLQPQPEPQPAPQPIYQQPVYQQPVYQQPVYQQPIYQQPVYQQPAPQPVYQQPEPQPQYPTDSFITKLSDKEKEEFCKTFVDKKEGSFSYLPDYVVGGDNKRFFSTVFIYFARVREAVSDELMNKFYEEINVM